MSWFKKKTAPVVDETAKISKISIEDILNGMSIGDKVYWLKYRHDSKVHDGDIKQCIIRAAGRHTVSGEIKDFVEIKYTVDTCVGSNDYTLTITDDLLLFKTFDEAAEYYRRWLKKQLSKDIEDYNTTRNEQYNEDLARIASWRK